MSRKSRDVQQTHDFTALSEEPVSELNYKRVFRIKTKLRITRSASPAGMRGRFWRQRMRQSAHAGSNRPNKIIQCQVKLTPQSTIRTA